MCHWAGAETHCRSSHHTRSLSPCSIGCWKLFLCEQSTKQPEQVTQFTGHKIPSKIMVFECFTHLNSDRFAFSFSVLPEITITYLLTSNTNTRTLFFSTNLRFNKTRHINLRGREKRSPLNICLMRNVCFPFFSFRFSPTTFAQHFYTTHTHTHANL